MKDTTEHLGILALGYLWNRPLQQLNNLFSTTHPEELPPEVLAAFQKLTVPGKRALKRAITAIFAKAMTDFCEALNDAVAPGEVLEIKGDGRRFSNHLPPWRDRLSYFDRQGDPKQEFLS